MLYLICMIHVQVNEFKADLAKYGELAASGETVVVTRYNKPFFKIEAPEQHDVGKVWMRPYEPILTGVSLREMLDTLKEDRDGDLP